MFSGRTLGETNDQIVESAHQDLKHRMAQSNYFVKNKEKDTHGHKMLQAVLHQNSYTVYGFSLFIA